jgi:hypothetical protein
MSSKINCNDLQKRRLGQACLPLQLLHRRKSEIENSNARNERCLF